MKITRAFVLLPLLTVLPAFALAGPSAVITDTSTPIQIDGDLSDWKTQPVIALDQKENVVLGQNDWTGPDYASAKIFVTYDASNLYIAADISSKTPQFNNFNASDIYNGDGLEVYIGTDTTNPQRKSYTPTDLQIMLSPGKNGDGAEVYCMTDQGDIPGAKIATKLTKTGYTLEASIPLLYLYKINVGPGKSIAFDVSLDDVGAMAKTRTVQLSWGKSDKSWQDPSGWGTLQFNGQAVYVNTAPKQGMPGATSVETDPSVGAKNASTQGVLVWGFNDGVGGFEGKVSQDGTTLTEGSGSLRIDADGSQGWNQNLAVCADVPMADKWETFKAMSLDVYLQGGALAKAGYGEFYIVTQSPSNNWYEIKLKLKEGWNHLRSDVDGTQFKGGVTKVYLVFNSGGPIVGPAIVDNIRGIVKGAPTQLKGTVVTTAGVPVPGAVIALAKNLATAGADGSFQLTVPEDDYAAEVIAPGYQVTKELLSVKATKPINWAVTLVSSAGTPKPAAIDVFFDKRIRSINPHYMFGNNIAAWYEPKWFTDPASLKLTSDISSYIRVPGGAYGNTWRWKTGEDLQKDGVSVQWVPDTKWQNMVDYIKSLPNGEPLLIANIMTADVQNTLDWIADAKAQGLKVNYVELGNEPDYEPALTYQGQTQYWTVINNYCEHYLEFAKAIKAKYPEIKIMGPTIAQVDNRERKEGSPWLAPATAPWWVEGFLEKCGAYVDVVSVHSYPYWSNDSDSNLLSKTSIWSEFVPKIREAIKKNVPDRYQKIEIAVSEWNSGDENSTTARLINGIFAADYLGQMMVWGVNQSNIWDMFTQKTGQGGGHGMIDPNNDTTRPFAPRAHYWALYMMEHYFGTSLYQAASSTEDLSTYASTGRGRKYVMVINRNPKTSYKTVLNLGSKVAGQLKLDFFELSSKEYQWSENLYRAVVNTGPAHLTCPTTVGNRFEYTFPPYSITCIEMTPVQ